MKRGILILGTLPPPIGGVTIYNKRLIEHLKFNQIPFHFIDFKKMHLLSILKELKKFPIIHIHSSNPYFRFLIVFISRLFKKKIFITFHGNIGRFNFVKNLFDYISIYLSSKIFTINIESFERSKKINKNSFFSSAFLLPFNTEPLSEDINLKIKNVSKGSTKIFCTNAFNVSFDKNKNEIYRIVDLIKLFKNKSDYSLIFSDPSSKYKVYLRENKTEVPNNVLIIDEIHDFIEVIKLSDALIRFTTTDGDSISVKEALSLGKAVIASDVVSRPSGVITVNNIEDLEIELDNLNIDSKINFSENYSESLFDIYKNELSFL
jgi:glycosyltransferase involved in cell wall biosynthesis